MWLLGWGDPCYQDFGCWLLVLLQAVSASMDLLRWVCRKDPPNTLGLMIFVLYLMKEAELASGGDEGMKFLFVWYTIRTFRSVVQPSSSGPSSTGTFLGLHCCDKLKFWDRRKFSEICCWGSKSSCVWCYVAGSWPTFRVNEVLSSLRAGRFKTFLRNGGRRSTQQFSVTSRMTCSSLKSCNERLL